MSEATNVEHIDNLLSNATSEERDVLITTIDNPYDPKDEFDAWLTYDSELGYNTVQRLAKTANYLREQNKNDDSELLYQLAIAEMIRLDPLKVYVIKTYPHTKPVYVSLTDEEKKIQELGKELVSKDERVKETEMV